MERLQKVIAASGIASRRKAEDLITNGKVKVNGEVVTELGTKVSDKDEIEVNNEIIEKETKEYYLLNKPRGVVSTTSDEKGRKTVTDLIPTKARIYPVGRLDYDTTGVLLLTNDGDFTNILMHPNNEVDKVYMAKLKGIIKGEQINKLQDGVELDDEVVKATKVKLVTSDFKAGTSSLFILTVVSLYPVISFNDDFFLTTVYSLLFTLTFIGLYSSTLAFITYVF